MTPEEEYPDLEQSLDEAGDFCRPRGQGWDVLLERFPPRQPPQSAASQDEPATRDEPLASPGPTPPPLPRTRGGRRLRPWVWWTAGALAAGLLTAAVVWQAWRAGDESVDPSDPEAPPVAEETEEPKLPVVEPVELAAGCQVTPVGNVAYQVIQPNRVQLDAGELYVEIDRKQLGGRPFLVETPAGVARAVGTSFVVESRFVEPKTRPSAAAANTSSTNTSNAAQGPTMTPRIPDFAFLTKVLVMAGVVQLISADVTVEGGAGETLEATNPRVIHSTYAASPIFWALRDKQVRDELALEQQQLLSIGRIGADYVASSREDWAGIMQLPPDQRPQEIQQTRQNTQRRLDLAGKKIREVLTAEQFETLMMAQLRVRGLRVLQTEPAVSRLEFEPEQKRLLRQRLTEMNQKLRALQQQMQQVRDQTFDEAMEVLTPEQLKALQEMEASGQRPLGPLQLQSMTVQTRPAAAVRQPARTQLQNVSPQAIRAQPNTRPGRTLQKVQPNSRDTRAVAPANRDRARD